MTEVKMDKIKEVIEQEFDMESGEFLNNSKKRKYTHPKQILCYFIRTIDKKTTLQNIAAYIANESGENYDHSTVIHSVNNIKDLIEFNKPTRLKIESITETLKQKEII